MTTIESPSGPVKRQSAVPAIAVVLNSIAILVGLACIALSALDVTSPVRVWLAVLLLTIGPGSGIVQFLRIREPALQFGLLVAISAAADLVVAQLFLSVNHIDGLTSAVVLTLITLVRPYKRSSKSKNTGSEAS